MKAEVRSAHRRADKAITQLAGGMVEVVFAHRQYLSHCACMSLAAKIRLPTTHAQYMRNQYDFRRDLDFLRETISLYLACMRVMLLCCCVMCVES